MYQVVYNPSISWLHVLFMAWSLWLHAVVFHDVCGSLHSFSLQALFCSEGGNWLGKLFWRCLLSSFTDSCMCKNFYNCMTLDTSQNPTPFSILPPFDSGGHRYMMVEFREVMILGSSTWLNFITSKSATNLLMKVLSSLLVCFDLHNFGYWWVIENPTD